MAYTMLEERTKRHLNIGEIKGNVLNLKSAALRFLHEHCEGLRFSKKMTEKEQKEEIGRASCRERVYAPV